MSSNQEILMKSISKLIDDSMESHIAIQGISIGTEIATNIFTKFKSDIDNINANELIASATSFLYISKDLYTNIAEKELKSTYIIVGSHVIILQIIKEVTGAAILSRKLAELEGISKYQEVLKNLLLKIAAFVETSEYINEDPIVRIMRAIPSATFLALISKDGLPLKIIDNGVSQGVMVGSQVAALSNIINVMMKSNMEYTLLQGDGSNIIIVQFDPDRILAISIPDNETDKIGEYLAIIQEIVDTY